MRKAALLLLAVIIASGCIGADYGKTGAEPAKEPGNSAASSLDSKASENAIIPEIPETAQQPADIDRFSKSTELHWGHMPVSYNITPECGKYEGRRIRWGFDVLANETGGAVAFREANGSADIAVSCFRDVPVSGEKFRQGESQPFAVGNRIVSAKINYYNVNPNTDYYPGGCIAYPDTEVHELLHAFGFIHSENPRSIMNSMARNCYVRKIDADIIEKLKETYGG